MRRKITAGGCWRTPRRLLSGGIYGFIFPLMLLAATGSPVLAGSLAALGMAARASVILAGGAMADRTDKARMIVIGSLCGAAVTAALALGIGSGSLPVPLLCLAHVLMELRGGYFGSTTNAALKDLVHPKQLGRAMAANQGRDSVLMLGSAPLGGVLLGLGGGIALLAVAVLNLIAAASGFAAAPASAGRTAILPGTRRGRHRRRRESRPRNSGRHALVFFPPATTSAADFDYGRQHRRQRADDHSDLWAGAAFGSSVDYWAGIDVHGRWNADRLAGGDLAH
ncbi:MFS transporter [Glutamicibacter halophytocola]|uniref:MFS transporter n=1 Tax=Glutamicibacter halophytocola TaxID=1933880 RepID=UPI003219E104